MPSTETITLPVLVVDDEHEILLLCEAALRYAGFSNVLMCADSRQTLPLIESRDIGVILLDLSMPHISGEELLDIISREHPEIPVIIITGANEVDTAVRCIKAGAFDYMVKPVEESRLITGVQRAVELRQLRREYDNLKECVFRHQPQNPEAFSQIITQHPLMYSLFQYAENIAPTPRPVLITGETGAGKELMAHAIHQLSGRPGSFVPVNISGVEDSLLSDMLFGHRKGAFTDASTDRGGLIEEAAGGTLFLDEIGDLSNISQVKILRLIQEGEYIPLGSDQPRMTDVRIIAATNHDLDALQREGRFRRDLFYRLHTHRIHLPPLRERKEDLPLLLNHFLGKAAATLRRPKPTTPPELVDLLNAWHFPGNIRELEAMVFDAVSHHQGRVLSTAVFRQRIQPDHGEEYAPAELQNFHGDSTDNSSSDTPFRQWKSLPTLKQASRLLIEEALQRANHNQSVAASLLGISPPSLSRRLKTMREDN